MSRSYMFCGSFIVVFLLVGWADSLDNGLARTPPMGWLSWVRFMCEIDCERYPDNCINEKLYKDMADRLAEDGWKELGYEYVNIDDCWSEMERDQETGKLVPNPERFPNGIKGLADYVHSKGLKLGLYGDIGTKTCGGYPGLWNGSLSLFELDAQTFAEWGIDSLKVDGCYMGDHTKEFDQLYPALGKALNSTGRSILYSCEWPLYQLQEGIQPDYPVISNHCNLVRPYYDVTDSWGSVLDVIDHIARFQDTFSSIQRPGAFYDPDMLVIGNFGLTEDQSRAQMAWWALFSAPLYMSNDLRKLKPEHKKILQNKQLIEVNQDSMGALGKRVIMEMNDNAGSEVWTKPMANGNFAVAYFNIRALGSPIFIKYQLREFLPYDALNQIYLAYDLFDENKVIGQFGSTDFLELQVNPSGGVRMVRLVPL